MTSLWDMSDTARALTAAGFIVTDDGRTVTGGRLERAWANLEDQTVRDRLASAGVSVIPERSTRLAGVLAGPAPDDAVVVILDPGSAGFAAAVAAAVVEYATAVNDPDDGVLDMVAAGADWPLPDTRVRMIAPMLGDADPFGVWRIHGRLVARAEQFLEAGPFASALPVPPAPADTLARLLLDAADFPFASAVDAYQALMDDHVLVDRAFAVERLQQVTRASTVRDHRRQVRAARTRPVSPWTVG